MIENAIAVVVGLIMGLFTLIVSVIVFVEEVARRGLQTLGVPHQVETALLALLLLLLIVASFRLFGRIFGVLIAIVLLAFLLHAVFVPQAATVAF